MRPARRATTGTENRVRKRRPTPHGVARVHPRASPGRPYGGSARGCPAEIARIRVVWIPLAATASALGYAAYASAWPSAQRWGRGIWKLPGERDEIALTFDDGPSNETPKFLAALDELDVRASFFLCGANVERRPGIARAIVEAGHGVGNHTYSHPFLPLCSGAHVREEVARTQSVITAATGREPGLFRPPFGLRAPALKRVLPELGLCCVHWTVICKDWKWGAPRIAEHVLDRARKGGIVCLHDGDRVRQEVNRAQTLEAVREVVPRLRARGFQFVVLPGWEAGTPTRPAVPRPEGESTGRSTRHR